MHVCNNEKGLQTCGYFPFVWTTAAHRSTQQHVTAAWLDGVTDVFWSWYCLLVVYMRKPSSHHAHENTAAHTGASESSSACTQGLRLWVNWPMCLAAGAWRDPSASHQHELGSGAALKVSVDMWLLERAQVLQGMQGHPLPGGSLLACSLEPEREGRIIH